MIGMSATTTSNFKKVEQAAGQASFRSLGHAAAAIRKTEIASIKPGEGPSAAGTPPHTHTQKLTKKGKVRKGQLPRSFAFHVDKAKGEAIVGPRASVVGTSASAHEFGGEYKGESFDARPFAAPALAENLDRFAEGFRGSLGS